MYAWEFMKGLGISDRKGQARFVSLQNLYNLLYREEEREMVPLCEEEGVGMTPWSPLARGILARSNIPNEQTSRSEVDPFVAAFKNQPDREIVAIVNQIAKQHKVTPAQVSLAWLLNKPAVASPIIGATKLSHLEDAAKAVDIKLSNEEIQVLEKPYRPRPHFGITPPFRTPEPGQLHDR